MLDDRYVERFTRKFWGKIDMTGGGSSCWAWTRYTDKDGYGVVYRRHKDNNERAHRVAWELTFGEIPCGLLVLHSCDNPQCCNPNHLFLGTTLDNVRDKMAKGRFKCPPQKRVTLRCTQCAKEYIVTQGRGTTSKFCSASCRTRFSNPVLARWRKKKGNQND